MNRCWTTAALATVITGASLAAPLQNDFVPGQVVVTFNAAAKASSALAHQPLGGTVSGELKASGAQLVDLPAGVSVNQALKYYRGLAGVKIAQPNYAAHAIAMPNDALTNQQYSIQAMKLQAGWDLTIGDPGVRIAVIDTGVDYNHEDLTGKVTLGYDYVNGDNDPMDDNGHGTHCAGIAAAHTNNGIGIAGMGYNANLVAYKVLSGGGSGSLFDTGLAIEAATDLGVDVISLSLGGYGDLQALHDSVDYAWNKGVVIFAGAGNDNTSQKFYPSAYENAISVGGTDNTNTKADFSNFGDWVDVAAPGVDIMSCKLGGGYVLESGTSMSTPNAAGVASLLISYAGKGNISNSLVRSILEETSVNVGTWLNFGLLNAADAIPLAVPPTIESVIPSAVRKFVGSSATGSAGNLAGTDGAYYTVNSSIVSGLGTVCGPEVTLAYTKGLANYLGGTATIRGYARQGVTASAYLKQNNGEYLFLKSWQMNGSSKTTTVNLPSNLTPYLTNRKFKIVVRAVLPTRTGGNQSYSLNLDQVTIAIKKRGSNNP